VAFNEFLALEPDQDALLGSHLALVPDFGDPQKFQQIHDVKSIKELVPAILDDLVVVLIFGGSESES